MSDPDFADTLERAERIVALEWQQFQQVKNEGGRAECQDDWPTFHGMRVSQFLTWPVPLLESYTADLEAAAAAGRNLVTEKYARMMASTEPERYARELEPYLPVLPPDRVALQEGIVAVQVAWARDFAARYPRLGAGMRRLTTAEDTLEDTSFETYLRGELGTYSPGTLALYGDLVEATQAGGGNLTERTLQFTVAFAGYESLEAAEAAQR